MDLSILVVFGCFAGRPRPGQRLVGSDKHAKPRQNYLPITGNFGLLVTTVWSKPCATRSRTPRKSQMTRIESNSYSYSRTNACDALESVEIDRAVLISDLTIKLLCGSPYSSRFHGRK